MIEVVLYRDAGEVMEIVRSLRQQGLSVGKDFDFAYNATKYDDKGWKVIKARHVVFMFHEEKWATWFALKWQ